MRHVSPDELDLYALGKLQPPDLEAFEEHVGQCRICLEKLLEAFALAARYDATVDD